MNRVSIIVTTFNRKVLLAETLESILAQSYPCFEVLVIDNCSQDGTEDLVATYRQRDNRISYYKNPNFGVIAHNLNYGIDRTLGKYIAFCDDDDIWLPDKLQKQVGILEENNQIGLVCTNARQFDKSGEMKDLLPKGLDENNFSFFGLLLNNYIIKSSVLIRKAILDNIGNFIDEKELCPADDYELWLRLTGYGYKVFYIDEVLIKYRVHLINYSHNRNWNKINLILYNRIYPFIKEKLTVKELQLFDRYLEMTREQVKYHDYCETLLNWIANSENIINEISKYMSKSSQLVIYGCGQLGELLLQYLNEKNINVLCFIDKFYREKYFKGIPVYKELETLNDNSQKIVIICVAYDIDKELKCLLMETLNSNDTIITIRECLK